MSPVIPGSHQTQAERREAAKARILAAAIELVGERGLDGFTMREVSARAHSSSSLAGHYYTVKADLLAAVAKELLAPPPKPPDPSRKLGLAELLGNMRSALAADLRDPTKARARLVFMAETQVGSPYGAQVGAYYRDRVSGISDHLAAGHAAGEIRAMDLEAEALVLLAMHRGMVLLALSGHLPVDRDRLSEAYIETVRRGLSA